MEKASSISPSKIPAPIRPIVAAALVAVAIDAALHLLPDGFMTRTLQSRAKEIVERPAAPIQIMGDSVSAAIRASVVAERIGRAPADVNNYSLPGTSPLFPYFSLRRQIAAGRIPKLIVFAPHPAHFGTPMFERFVGRYATAGETLDLSRAGAKFDDLAFGALCRASYTLRYREEFYGVLTQGNLEFFHTLRTPAVSVALSQQVQPRPPVPASTTTRTFSEGDLPGVLLAGFSVDPVCRELTRQFLDLAAEHRIPVLWISMPSIGILNERWERAHDTERFAAFLEDLAAKHSNFTILHAKMETWPDASFTDARHLTPPAAWRFSEQLGDELAAYLKANPLPE